MADGLLRLRRHPPTGSVPRPRLPGRPPGLRRRVVPTRVPLPSQTHSPVHPVRHRAALNPTVHHRRPGLRVRRPPARAVGPRLRAKRLRAKRLRTKRPLLQHLRVQRLPPQRHRVQRHRVQRHRAKRPRVQRPLPQRHRVQRHRAQRHREPPHQLPERSVLRRRPRPVVPGLGWVACGVAPGGAPCVALAAASPLPGPWWWRRSSN